MSDFDLPFAKRHWWRTPDLNTSAKKVAVQQLVARHSDEYLTLLRSHRRLFGIKEPT